MNVEIGAEAALFPDKEYISGIFVAVCSLVGRYNNPIPTRFLAPIDSKENIYLQIISLCLLRDTFIKKLQ